MRYFLMLLGAGAITLLDRLTKYLTVQRIPFGEKVPVWDGVFCLTHYQNTGMAFSLLEGKHWLFVALTILFLVVAVIAVLRRWISHPVELAGMVCIVGGAVGNMIDRAVQGYVVDMIELQFMEFAVFNVADCFICVGAGLLVLGAALATRKKPAPPEEGGNDPAV